MKLTPQQLDEKLKAGKIARPQDVLIYEEINTLKTEVESAIQTIETRLKEDKQFKDLFYLSKGQTSGNTLFDDLVSYLSSDSEFVDKVRGKDAIVDYPSIIKEVLANIPTPKDGVSPQLDYKAITEKVLSQLPKPDISSMISEAISKSEENLKSLIPTIPQIQEQTPMMGTEIRNALELLQGDDRLKAEAISGLDDFVKKIQPVGKIVGGGSIARNLYQLFDVAITNPQTNDTLIYDASTGRWANGSAGSASPLTTKGDLYTFSTVNARLPVGTNGQVLSSDSTQATGLKWIALAGGGDMVQATYDPAGIGEQLVGLTATQTLSNKTFVAPALGTPASGVATNLTGTAASLTAGKATILATARTIGGVSFDGSANITVATATGGFTISGGDLALGANNITMTGSLGATGARLTKGWFTDLQVTNAIVGSITGNAATVTNATLTTALTVNTGTLTLTANAANTSVLTIGAGAVSVSGANTGDQTITLTGDVTGSGTGSFATTIKSSVALAGNPTTTTQSPSDNSTKIATTAYVDNAVLGQNFKEAVKYASIAALPSIVYANGASGVGATLTGVALAAISLDSSSPAVNDRVLIKNQASTFQNGIYTVTATGSGIAVFVLTRATDADQTNEFKTGDSVFVTSGNTLATTTWAYTGIDSPTMGTDAITYVQTAGQGSFTAGNGITITGVSIAINTAITADLPSNQTFAGIKTFTPTARSAGTASYLTVNAPADTGITAATESKGINIVGSTRTWVDGTVATQREYFFGAPTYNKTTTSATFTNLGTLVVSGAPIAGTGVTLTHPWALWVQGGNSHFGGQVGATQAGVGGTGAEFNDSNNTTGGQTVNIQNTNNGTSAFSGVALGNDQTVDGGGTAHFFGIFFNSSTYNDTTFGTANAIASLGAIENTDGPIALIAAANSYINFVAGGAATTNEVGRFTTAGLTVGLTGTLTGAIKFAGATSTQITLQGQAVGSSGVLTLPAATDTLVGKATTDTFTNKTLTSSTNVLGGVTMTLGSDADGDIYYRASNVLTRLAKGTAGQVLAMNGGATAPIWSSAGAGTVTNTGGNLTSNAIVLGAGTADVKVVAGIITDGTSVITLGVNTTTIGKLKMFGNTSGDATIQPAAVAGTSTVLTLPAITDTLVGKTTTDTLTNKILSDSTSKFGNVSDTTKTLIFSLGGATTSTALTLISSQTAARSITFPDATGTLPIIIASSGTASSTTNSASEVNLVVVTIPAGIMGTNGCLVIDVLYKFVGTAGTKTPIVRHSTSSGDTSAGTLILNAASGNTALSQRTVIKLNNSNSASAQIGFPAASNLNMSTSTITPVTGSINTANASYININGLCANSGDTVGVVAYTVTFYPGV